GSKDSRLRQFTIPIWSAGCTATATYSVVSKVEIPGLGGSPSTGMPPCLFMPMYKVTSFIPAAATAQPREKRFGCLLRSISTVHVFTYRLFGWVLNPSHRFIARRHSCGPLPGIGSAATPYG
ncbi:hypothetical protein EJB05_03587, partial [Eragrostis curvula]